MCEYFFCKQSHCHYIQPFIVRNVSSYTVNAHQNPTSLFHTNAHLRGQEYHRQVRECEEWLALKITESRVRR